MDFGGLTRPVTDLLDGVMDRAPVLGYTKIGSGLRRHWWPADPAPDALIGKRVVVSGATAGIGLQMARAFAGLGATVHLLVRDPAKVRGCVRAISAEFPAAELVGEVCDVSDLGEVADWTDGFAKRVPALNGLVHNAGLMPKQRFVTSQGHELQFATHVLGPQLMTERLLPLLRAARGASVVFVSSGGMYSSPLVIDDLEYLDNYNGVRAYARTKRMQVVPRRRMVPPAVRHRHPGGEHASRMGGHPRCGGVPAAVPGRDQTALAGSGRRRRHRGVAGGHPPAVQAGPFLARPRPASDHLRLAAA